jgi:5'-nucleotidase
MNRTRRLKRLSWPAPLLSAGLLTTVAIGAAPASAAQPVKPLTIVVTNDDGYNAPGINAVVQALRKLPKVTIKVVAPATNQSVTGAKTTPGTVPYTKGKTLAGYPAVAVNGYPADTVRVALDELHLHPNLVVSGANLGQNLGPVLNISGTVGAARAAAGRGVPAVAVSQGVGSTVEFGVAAKTVAKWVTAHRAHLKVTKVPQGTIVNINAPSCDGTGSPRGTVTVPPGTSGSFLINQNCASTLTKPPDDVTALNNGYIVVDQVPAIATP